MNKYWLIVKRYFFAIKAGTKIRIHTEIRATVINKIIPIIVIRPWNQSAILSPIHQTHQEPL